MKSNTEDKSSQQIVSEVESDNRFEQVEIDLNTFRKDVLCFLIKESLEKNLTINQVIVSILTKMLDKSNPKS